VSKRFNGVTIQRNEGASMNRIAATTVVCLALFLVPTLADETVGGQADIQQAKELFEEGWWDDAARVLEDLLEKNSTDPEVYSQLALVYVAKTNLGMWVDRSKMEEYARKAVELDGSNSEYRMIFGHAVGLRALRGSKLNLRRLHRLSSQRLVAGSFLGALAAGDGARSAGRRRSGACRTADKQGT
jgi:hypothetical protein